MSGGGWEEIATGAAFITVSTALVLAVAATGELIAEKSGVLNLGLEGMFIAGALGGFYTAFQSGNSWLGYLGGAFCGAALGAVFASLVVALKLNQVVAGILFAIVALAAADVLWDVLFGLSREPPRLAKLSPISLPVLSRIPVLGRAMFERILPEYLAIVLIGLVGWMLYRTRLGLAIRSAGEDPDALHFSGRRVARYRFGAVIFGCLLAGLGGALMTVGQLGFYAPGVTAGRGWIAIAIVIMGRWNPWLLLLSAILFGGADMLQTQVQAAGFKLIPHEFLVAFPYLVAVLALLLRRGSIQAPAKLGEPFFRPT